MKKYLQDSLPFLLLSAVTVVVLGLCLIYCDKVQMHLWLNGTHTAAEDFFFRYYTCVGEWVPYVIVGLLLFYKAGWASFLLTDVLLSGLIGQGIKHLFNTDRPYRYFSIYAPDIQLQFVDGVHISQWYSFPSGHTITFFALFLTLSIILQELRSSIHNSQSSIINNQSSILNPQSSQRSLLPATCNLQPIICNLLSVTCYLLALLGAYSRIYLNQHFAEDIFGGIIIGVGTTIGLLFLVPKLEHTKFWNWTLHKKKRLS